MLTSCACISPRVTLYKFMLPVAVPIDITSFPEPVAPAETDFRDFLAFWNKKVQAVCWYDGLLEAVSKNTITYTVHIWCQSKHLYIFKDLQKNFCLLSEDKGYSTTVLYFVMNILAKQVV